MKYIEGFRDADAARFLHDKLAATGEELAREGRTVRVMEVCGSHTMAIARFGVRGMLPDTVSLLSGPGCPVCVTDAAYIDAAIELAEREIIIATFGDMMRVPGSRETLAQLRAAGAEVEVCYSPEGALVLARNNPEREVVFLGIGFETTTAPVVSLVHTAQAQGVRNLSVLTAFKLVPPALDALIADVEVQIDAFLCPAHVSAIIGSEAYRPIVEQHSIPCAVAGFEPLDILYGVQVLAEMLAQDKPALVNHYARVVRPEGNLAAKTLIDAYLEPVDAGWRGLGELPRSGLGLRERWSAYDAAKRFSVSTRGGSFDPRCRCGDVLKGKIIPPQCPIFGKVCTPDNPVGACMVSSEGSCAAYYRYSRTD